MNNKEETRLAHNAIAHEYYELYKDDQTDLLYFDEFLSMCNNKILDLGCGMGHYSNYMYNKGFDVTGIDFSEEMIKIARNMNSNIKYIVSDVCDLKDIDSKIYDGIVLAYLLQHLSKQEVNRLFINLKDYIKKDTKLLMFLREGNSVLEEVEPINPKYKYVINEYSQEEIRELLENNGWEVFKLVRKDFVDDPNSLAPNTLVVIANYTNN